MKTESIRDYILQNEKNLHIAATVSEAWLSAREKIVAGFLRRLKASLRKELKGWKFYPEGRFFVDQYPTYRLRKRKWKQHWIGLQCDDYGDRMLIGIGRETAATREMPLHPDLLSALKKISHSAKSHKWWEARVPLRSPAPDWRKPEILWRMHKDKHFLTEVAEQLLEIVKVSEQTIDQLSRKGK